MHARQAEEERQQASPSPNDQARRQSIHKSLATAISNNLEAIKNADAIKAGDHLLSNFSSTASNQQPGMQWTGLPGGELKFPEVPSVSSQPNVTMQQVDELILLQQQLQRAQQKFLRDVSSPNPEETINQNKRDEVNKEELVAQLRSVVAQKLPLEQQPVPESDNVIIEALTSQLKLLQQQLHSERSQHQQTHTEPHSSLVEQVASLNSQLSELHKQISSERAAHTEQFSSLQNENKRLQEIVNKSNHDVAVALRKSGEEVAQQWQIQNELQGKLAEQTRIAQASTEKLLTYTNEIQQRDQIIATLRSKLREKQDRLRDVAEMANVRQRSESRELAQHIDAMQEQSHFLMQGGQLPECLSPGESFPINKIAPSPDFSRAASNNKSRTDRQRHHQERHSDLPPNSLRNDLHLQPTLPPNSLRDESAAHCYSQPEEPPACHNSAVSDIPKPQKIKQTSHAPAETSFCGMCIFC
eukprot:TRINITY_DN5724_c0_g1_i1.p1 TRINITY_DN5724_c0_g1~~TRINITY_DN5724_c0_g1_i1.p1  ORF type:complete len:540 (+),score=99.37 TRINITY_DN5724_c0_g1_i1:210-1622(+)